MKNNVIYNLSQDLIRLYAKTHHKAIENLYIKCLAEVDPSNSYQTFGVWIKGNYERIEDYMHVDTAIALVGLYILQEQHMNAGMIMAIQGDIKLLNTEQKKMRKFLNADTLGIVGVFKNYIADQLVGFILQPFEKEIDVVASHWGIDKADSNLVYDDLSKIANFYNERSGVNSLTVVPKIDPKQLKMYQIQMFSSLLNKATEDVAKEFEQAGNKDAAQKIRGGALAQPNVLGRFIGQANITQTKTRYAERVVDSILNRYDPKYVESNYELIKKDALSLAGAQIEEPEKTEFDPSKFMGSNVDSQKIYEEIEKQPKAMNLKKGWWTHPPVLTMLSLVFYFMRQKIYGG